MRFLQLLPLALAASAFVIPDEQTLESLTLEKPDVERDSLFEHFTKGKESWKELEEELLEDLKCAKHKVEDVVENAFETVADYAKHFEIAAYADWLKSADDDLDLLDEPPPHHGPPHRGPPGPPGKGPDKKPPPHHGPGKKPPPHHGPGGPHKNGSHHHPPHGMSNLTVFQMIAKSNYTTKLAELISEYDDLVELLNGTTANFTVFAPTDMAFAKIPKDAPKPPKEFLKKLLSYHVIPEFYPAGRVLFSRTIPTALTAEAIGNVSQRLSTQIGFKGLTLNYYARVIAVNIFGTNGVIHGLDSILVPPPKVTRILSLFPTQFSTLELALIKTGLYPLIDDTTTHEGGTLFAPSNGAFAMLGPKANAFLFSKFGEKYLKALMLYHVVDNITLYSDAIYKADSEDTDTDGPQHFPKGKFHVDLPTALAGKSLSIDIARFGRLVTIRINSFTRVSVADGIAADGVIHVVPHVLIPPKDLEMPGIAEEDISVEDLMERLEPYIDNEEGDESDAKLDL